MSAWPEAVWVSKKIKIAIEDIYDIEAQIAENNEKIDTLNGRLDDVTDLVDDANDDISAAQETLAADQQALSDLDQAIDDLADELDSIGDNIQPQIDQVNQDIAALSNTVDKELVVIAENTGTSQDPYPRDIGTNVSKHSIFLILS